MSQAMQHAPDKGNRRAHRVLLVRQKVDAARGWSLPGGRLEQGETLQEAMAREMLEETGLKPSIKRLLYVAEKPEAKLIHITFELERISGGLACPRTSMMPTPSPR